jgi:hypothetical protein
MQKNWLEELGDMTQAWTCDSCGALFAEYVNGCPHCWADGEKRSPVTLKTKEDPGLWPQNIPRIPDGVFQYHNSLDRIQRGLLGAAQEAMYRPIGPRQRPVTR